MTKTPGSSRRTSTAPATPQSFQQKSIHNAILRGLPRKEFQAVFASAEIVVLPTRTILNEIDREIRHAYFVETGLASILNVTSTGKSVEVGLAGYDGFVGLPLLVDFKISPTRAVMQIGGMVFRISTGDLKSVLRANPILHARLHRYAQEFALQVTQVAACNRLHRVDQRLARWFLMSQDRMGSAKFQLTQEFLSHMLGTRRASVTIAAGALSKAGLILYRRGKVTIEDRAGLEKAACECYASLTRQLKQWHAESG